MATHSSILAWRIPWREEPGRLLVHGVAKSWTRLRDSTHTLSHFNKGLFFNNTCVGKVHNNWQLYILMPLP